MAWYRVSFKRQPMVGTSFNWSNGRNLFGAVSVKTLYKDRNQFIQFLVKQCMKRWCETEVDRTREVYTLNRRSPARLSLHCKSEGQLSESTNNLRPVWTTVNTTYHILFLNNNETLLLRVYLELPHSQKTSNWPRIKEYSAFYTRNLSRDQSWPYGILWFYP